ncbi:hypothetical protein, partial [Lentzea pudingi]|uniref:hypothetical protein n=1 Tax=Lentzea pudingi TaxID=1789439 RepID=UPI001E2B3DB1
RDEATPPSVFGKDGSPAASQGRGTARLRHRLLKDGSPSASRAIRRAGAVWVVVVVVVVVVLCG